MKIKDIINVLESRAPLSLQESYDNAGLLTGNSADECSGVLCCLDVTEAVIAEAEENNCNLVVAHHPVIFKGLKQLTGKNYVERIIIQAIKKDIAIYAIHTNLDNVLTGVNGRMADMLGLTDQKILLPKTSVLLKLYTFVPVAQAEQVRAAIFAAGAGHIGNYSECSFNVEGTGSFKGNAHTTPFKGIPGERHYENEMKIEVIFPQWLRQPVTEALVKAHPNEEPAYDIISLENDFGHTGSGLVGELTAAIPETAFLAFLRKTFKLSVIRHTAFTGRPIQKVALCGGAGSFLISNALRAKADIFITADIRYHEFFDAEERMIVADIGHFESEQYTIDLLHDLLREKFPTFAVLKTVVTTNPVRYYT